MKKILVCCGQTAFAKLLAAADGEFELTQTEREPSAAECGEYDAALFVLPSLAAPRAETVKRLAREAAAGIAVLVRAEERAAAEELFAGFGVLVAAANDSAKNIFSLLSYAAKAGERLRLFGTHPLCHDPSKDSGGDLAAGAVCSHRSPPFHGKLQ